MILNSVYDNEYPVVYDAPKPDKINFTDEDLYKADKFTFGSIIGAITNKSTSALALLDGLKEEYGEDSKEYKTTLKRIKMCTKLQSAQIDKAKIGRNVKGIPKTWTDRKYIEEMDVDGKEKDFLKRIMLDRHPYFFIHLYKNTKRKYKKYIDEYNLSAMHKFSIGIQELVNKENKTKEEQEYVDMFYKYMPVIDTNSVMNNVAKYIESIDFEIKSKLRNIDVDDIHLILMRNNEITNEDTYNEVLKQYRLIKKEISQIKSINNVPDKSKYSEDASQEVDSIYQKFKERMDEVCNNTYELVDYLIKIFYCKYPSDNKDLLWNVYGDIIFENVKSKNNKKILFPLPDSDGNIEYLHDKFSLKEVELHNEI